MTNLNIAQILKRKYLLFLGCWEVVKSGFMSHEFSYCAESVLSNLPVGPHQ